MNSPQNPAAFGAPGIEPRWTFSAKDGVGTAYDSSVIEFTFFLESRPALGRQALCRRGQRPGVRGRR